MPVIPNRPTEHPFSSRWVNRALIILLIIAAIAAGYYANLSQSQARTIRRLRDQVKELTTPVVMNQE